MKIPKWGLALVLIAALAGSFAAGYYVAPKGSSGNRAMTLLLDFAVSGYHVGPYVALDKGFYRDEGIDITIRGGRGSEQTVLEVGTGSADFGFSNLDDMIRARKAGYDEVMIGMFFNTPPYGFSTLKSDDITKPSDFIGKTITYDAGDQEYLTKWFAANGIDMQTQVPSETMDWEVRLSELLLGRIHGVYAYYGSLDTMVVSAAQERGIETSFLFLGDFNWTVYGSGWVTTKKLIDENPTLVEGFMRATWKGYDYYVNHPDESIDILAKYNPEIDTAVAKISASESLEMAIAPETLEHGYGYMLNDKIVGTLDKVEVQMNAADIYTNQFVFSDLKPPTTAPPR